MTWEESLLQYLEKNQDISSIWVGKPDGQKWGEVGPSTNICISEIQAFFASPVDGKTFGGVSYVHLRNVEGCDVYKKGGLTLATCKGDNFVIVVIPKGAKVEPCLQTLQQISEYLKNV